MDIRTAQPTPMVGYTPAAMSSYVLIQPGPNASATSGTRSNKRYVTAFFCHCMHAFLSLSYVEQNQR